MSPWSSLWSPMLADWFERLDIGIILVNASQTPWTIMWANRRVAEWAGYPEGQCLVGLSCTVISADQREAPIAGTIPLVTTMLVPDVAGQTVSSPVLLLRYPEEDTMLLGILLSSSARPLDEAGGPMIVGPWITEIMRNGATKFIHRFYEALKEQPELEKILRSLSEAEWTRLQSHQRDHLIHLVDPDRSLASVEDEARRVGYIHGLIGLDAHQVFQAFMSYRHIMEDLMHQQSWEPSQRWVIAHFVHERLFIELGAQLAAIQAVRSAWNRAVYDGLTSALQMTDPMAAWHTIARQWQGIPGILGIAVYRPDFAGHWESVVAEGPLWSTVSPQPRLVDQHSLREAWWEEKMVIVDSHHASRSKKDGVSYEGVRSSIYVPLMDGTGHPAAILGLYGQYPHQWQVVEVQEGLSLLSVALGKLWPTQSPVSHRDSPFPRRSLASGQWEYWYQPVVSLTSGYPVKWEALARWREPSGRIWMPGDFLPVMGLADHRGFLAAGIAAAIRDAATFAPARVAVNIVPELLDGDIESFVSHADCPLLTLEVLETGRISEAGLHIMRRLAAQGVEWALDDFGTEFSNLDRLWHGPWTWIKFDRRLWAQVWSDPVHWIPTIGQLVEVCMTLGFQTVIEGVETPEAAAIARALGFTAAQGYFWGRPAPLSAWCSAQDWKPVAPHTGGVRALWAWHWRWTRRSVDEPESAICLNIADHAPDIVRRAHEAVHRSPHDPGVQTHWNTVMRNVFQGPLAT